MDVDGGGDVGSSDVLAHPGQHYTIHPLLTEVNESPVTYRLYAVLVIVMDGVNYTIHPLLTTHGQHEHNVSAAVTEGEDEAFY